MEKGIYNFQTTWEEVVEMKGEVAALLQKAEIRGMNPIVIDKLSEVKKGMEELDGIMSKINLDGIMANINKGANNGRDKKVFLLDKMTFPNALNFSGSEDELEEIIASNNYFDDDIVKIDANGYNSVREAIKNEWCNLSSDSEDLEDVLKDWYVIPFGF